MSGHKQGSFGSNDHVEGGYGASKGGCKNHCKRFWWVYLIAAIAIIVLVVCLIIFVAVPKIAQKKIDESVLSIQGISALNTKSESYRMSINSTITTDGSVHATIDGFSGVMYLEDLEGHVPFATLDFPETTSDKFQVVNVSQEMQITDMAAFTTFNTWLLANESLRVTVEGDTHVHVNGIAGQAYGVHFKKTIEMPGLSMFNGTTVKDINITVIADDDGNNMHATTVIPNRSLVTFEIGNATFRNYLLGEEVGEVFINNMILRPGLNEYPMAANVEQTPVLNGISEEPYCENGVLPFQLLGKSVINNGQPLSYFADALASQNQTVPIDLTAPLTALGLDPKCV